MNGLAIDLELVWDSLPAMLGGLWTTMLITVIVIVLGLIFSVPLTLARMSANRALAWPAAFFVMFFRGAPLLILLYLVYYGFGQIEVLREGPLWFVFGSAFACAVIGLTLNHLAFMVDVVRGSLQAVPAGLSEASNSLGISPRDTFRHIQLPLAMRYGIKAYQNEVVMLTKGTAVIGVITIVDLTAVANQVFETTYDPFTPMLTVAAFYWVFVNAIRFVLGRLETHLNRHQAAEEARRNQKPVRSVGSVSIYPARWRKAGRTFFGMRKEHAL